jgi:G3E family GTPase
MADAPCERTRLTLLTGFLGAGKTSWLRHHLQHGVFQDSAVVVNEAAAQPVDDALLSHAKHLSTLSGGCACCERRPELIALLRDLSAPASGHVVIEASGLADPKPIVEAIRGDIMLSQSFEIGEVITIVDGRNGGELLRSDKLARRQVESADCIIVSKLEETDESTVKQLLQMLRWFNPHAALFGANRGVEVALPGFEEALSDPPLIILDDDDLPISAIPLDVSPMGWQTFSLWLSALLYARGRDLLRVKGIVQAPTGRLLIQAVKGVVGAPEILPTPSEDGDGVVVFIGRGFTHDELARSLSAFAGAARPLG